MAKGRKTGGRSAGTPNKATAEIKQLAGVHGPRMVEELARLAVEAESEAARVSAIRELLDRAYGKPQQPIEMSHDATDWAAFLQALAASRELPVKPSPAGEAALSGTLSRHPHPQSPSATRANSPR